jgi:hypothetical protein
MRLDPSKKLLRAQYVEQVSYFRFDDFTHQTKNTSVCSKFKWNAFNEKTLMIRKPAVEIINYIKQLDLSNPAYKFFLCNRFD